MKTKNYLKKTAKNLFLITNENNGKKKYMKIIVDEKNNTFRRIIFDENFNVINDSKYDIKEKVSIRNKEYVSPFLKRSVIFYRSWDNELSYKSIKHFKKFKEIFSKYLIKDLSVV
jgi:hypothetical protein